MWKINSCERDRKRTSPELTERCPPTIAGCHSGYHNLLCQRQLKDPTVAPCCEWDLNTCWVKLRVHYSPFSCKFMCSICFCQRQENQVSGLIWIIQDEMDHAFISAVLRGTGGSFHLSTVPVSTWQRQQVLQKHPGRKTCSILMNQGTPCWSNSTGNCNKSSSPISPGLQPFSPSFFCVHRRSAKGHM